MRKVVCLIAVAALGFWGLASRPVEAQTAWEAWIGGVPLTCTNWRGQPVTIVSNPYLNDIGVAHTTMNGQPVIQLNPNVMNRYSTLVQVWWFTHECGHHALHPLDNGESAADCWGIREMRKHGLIWNVQQLNAFAYELQGLQGTRMGHLPGPLRAQNIAYCALT